MRNQKTYNTDLTRAERIELGIYFAALAIVMTITIACLAYVQSGVTV